MARNIDDVYWQAAGYELTMLTRKFLQLSGRKRTDVSRVSFNDTLGSYLGRA